MGTREDRLARKTIKALAKLGKTQSQIRASLKRRRIKGVPSNPISCPIAQYLHRALGHDGTAEVRTKVVIFSDQSPWVDVPLPRLIQRFIANFDDDKYPELKD